MISYGSMCSGIEAASVAWESLGFSPVWFSEIEKFPRKVLEHHWPHVMNVGSMLLLPKLIKLGLVHAPEVVVGGTPCQSYSVAGKGLGLDDPRGQLTLAYVDVMNTIDSVRGEGDECVCVWENVPGVLSDKGNAFGHFLAKLAGEDGALVPAGKKWSNAGCVFGPKRAIAWRVLDAQYFGVAQRRRRVFLVASARKGFCPSRVLFEFEGVRRDIVPSRKEGAEVTGAITQNSSSSSGMRYGEGVVCMATGQGGAEISKDLGPTLTCNHEAPIVACHDIAPTLNAHFGEKQGLENQHVNGGCGVFVVHGTQDPCTSKDLAFALGRNNGGENAIVQSVSLRGREGGATAELGGDLSPCIRASSGGGDKPHVLERMKVRRLMPVECERLQGFPDGHTDIMANTPDGPRYKALGNSMAVPCMKLIGERLYDLLNANGRDDKRAYEPELR